MKRSAPFNVEPSSIPITTDQIGTPIRSVLNDRTKVVTQLLSPQSQLFSPSNFVQAVSGETNKVESILNGPSLNIYYPFGSNNILEGFRLNNNAIPDFNTVSYPLAELAANVKHTITRVSKPVNESTDSIGQYEIGLMLKTDKHNNSSLHHHLPSFPGVGKIQQNPMTIVNPATFNYFQLLKQTHDASLNYDEYLSKEPSDYMDKWSWEGVVEFEETWSGGESFSTSGFYGSARSDQGFQESCGYKLLTFTARGPEFMYNYFGSNICPGGKCYSVFKKYNVPPNYSISSKRNISSLIGRKTTNSPWLANGLPRDKPFKPYQMAFFCLPKGGQIPDEIRTYTDEMGIKRRDAIVTYLGTIFSIPHGFTYKSNYNYLDTEPVTCRYPDRPDEGSKPFTNSYDAMDNT